MKFFSRKKKKEAHALPSKLQPPPTSVRRQEQSRKQAVAPVQKQQQQQRPRQPPPKPLAPPPASVPVRAANLPTTNIAAVATAIANDPTPPPQAPVPPPVDDSTQVQQVQESNQAGIDLTRNLVKKFIADIWNRGEVDLIPEVCSPSLRFNGNTGFDRVGHDGLARMVATIRDALDDYHCEIHSMVVEHNKAFCRLRFTGKHTGNLLGYPPTGRVVGWMGATEFTCQNGKILKVWELGDIKTLEEQLIAIDDQPLGDHNE